MPAYPIEPDKLLDAADRLAPATPGRGRPPYTAHRRAVSTAYYAVFHAVTARVVEIVFPTADAPFHRRIRRWVGHGDVKAVSQWVAQLQGTVGGTPPPHIRDLLAPPGQSRHIDADTATIADGFLDLHARREQADYDHDAVFTRPDTRGLIQVARQVVDVIERAESDPASRFFGLVALQAKIQPR